MSLATNNVVPAVLASVMRRKRLLMRRAAATCRGPSVVRDMPTMPLLVCALLLVTVALLPYRSFTSKGAAPALRVLPYRSAETVAVREAYMPVLRDWQQRRYNLDTLGQLLPKHPQHKFSRQACLEWRETRCDNRAKDIPHKAAACHADIVPRHRSGYCYCTGATHVPFDFCDNDNVIEPHRPFRCEEVCARP